MDDLGPRPTVGPFLRKKIHQIILIFLTKQNCKEGEDPGSEIRARGYGIQSTGYGIQVTEYRIQSTDFCLM